MLSSTSSGSKRRKLSTKKDGKGAADKGSNVKDDNDDFEEAEPDVKEIGKEETCR